MLVFIVCDITHARRARATVCKAGPILGMRSMNRCKGRVHSTPRATARITTASVMPTMATKAAYLASPSLPTSPNRNGSMGLWFGPLIDPHDPNQESDDQNGQEQLDGRPGDGGQEVPPQRDLVLVVTGQLLEHFAEVARLLADLHHFAEEGRKEIAGGGQPLAEGPALIDRLADRRQMPAGRKAMGGLYLAGADRPFIDAGQEAHRRPLAEGGKLLERHSRAEEHDGRPPWVENRPSCHCIRRSTIGKVVFCLGEILMTIRFKLTTTVIAVILVANLLFSLITLQYLNDVWMREVQTRVRRNLNAARAAYGNHLEVMAARL